MQDQQTLWQTLMPVAIVAVVLALRWRRMSRHRPLTVSRMWILPALLAVLLATTLVAMPVSGLAWLWIALALAIGAALGWQRGRLVRITVDPETGALRQQGSPAGLILIVLIVGLKTLLRPLLGHNAFVGDAFLALAVGAVAVQRIEMAVRARRLLARPAAPPAQ